MGKPKPINWAAIKKRYLQGESPAKIAEDYEVGPKAITKRAYKENWRSQKEQIEEKVVENVAAELQSLEAKKIAFAHLAIDTFMYGFTVVAKQMSKTENPYRQDGEGLSDPFFVEAFKAGKELLKTVQEVGAGGPEASRPVYRSIYQTGEPDPAATRNFASKEIVPLESGDSGAEEWEDDRGD